MEILKILAAAVGSPEGAQALRAGAQVAAASGAHLLALRVTDNPWKLVGPEEETHPGRVLDPAEVLALAEDRLGWLLSRLVDPPLPPDRVSYHVGLGIPAVEIAKWAEVAGADLIVLGREPAARFLGPAIGRTISGTVRRARVPCLVTPGAGAFRRILAAVDASPDAADVLEAAFGLGQLFGGDVIALHVEKPVALADAALPRTETARHAEAAAKAVAAAWAREPAASPSASTGLRDPTTACDVIVRQGDPVGEILRTVREESIDVLVIGHHRGGPSTGADTGSISPRLLGRASCAVLTVPL